MMIKTNHLTYKYKRAEDEEELIAVNDVSISVNKGEFVAILGRNGSGKSTLAKLMNALLVPTSGDCIMDGMNTKDESLLWEIRKRAGMVFQNPDNQIIATIAEEDVAFGPENLGVPTEELRKRVDAALERVGMSEYKKHAPHLLSGGQKQRIGIAGILAMNPECIILDEPTAMLDPIGRDEVMRTILSLNKQEGTTIVLITHFMEEAVLADRIIIMDDGVLYKEGTPREIFSDVEGIKRIGLDIPQVTELAFELKNRGIDVGADVLNIEELVERL